MRKDLPAQERRRHLRQIGFIFQAFNLIGDLTVFENVELPLTYRGMPASERKKRVEQALERVGMANRMKHYPSKLSGGLQQRVAVARALGGDPSVLLADEPTGNLDSKNGEAVMELLHTVHESGATICIVTHDQRFESYAQRIVRLFDYEVVEGPAVGQPLGALDTGRRDGTVSNSAASHEIPPYCSEPRATHSLAGRASCLKRRCVLAGRCYSSRSTLMGLSLNTFQAAGNRRS